MEPLLLAVLFVVASNHRTPADVAARAISWLRRVDRLLLIPRRRPQRRSTRGIRGVVVAVVGVGVGVGVDIGNAGAQLCCDLRTSCVIPVKESEVTSAPSWRTVIKDNVVFAGCTWTDESKSGMLDC
jgi:hypothetical protein